MICMPSSSDPNHPHHDLHDHTYDPFAKPPYVPLIVLAGMVLLGIGLAVYFY